MEYPNQVPEKPLVSICVTTYRHEKFIAETLDSIINQEVDFQIEILVGEDDSPDNTRAICKDYADRFPELIRLQLNDRSNVIYINERPTGRWNLKNLFKKARGKYIAFIEGDDYYTDMQKLAKQVNAMEQNPDCTVSCTGYEKYFDQHSKPNQKIQISAGKYSAADTLQNKIAIATCTLMFKNLQEIYFPDWYDLSPFGDLPLIQIHLTHGNLIALSDVTTRYRIHPGGFYSGVDEIKKSDLGLQTLEVVRDNIQKIDPDFDLSLFKLKEAGYYYRKSFSEAALGNKKHAIRDFKKYVSRSSIGLSLIKRIIIFPLLLTKLVQLKPD